MSRKIFAGFTAIVEPIDIRLCCAVIKENEDDEKYKIVITDHFMEINGRVVDVSNYEDGTFGEFSTLEEATEQLPIIAFCVDSGIRKTINEMIDKIADEIAEGGNEE